MQNAAVKLYMNTEAAVFKCLTPSVFPTFPNSRIYDFISQCAHGIWILDEKVLQLNNVIKRK